MPLAFAADALPLWELNPSEVAFQRDTGPHIGRETAGIVEPAAARVNGWRKFCQPEFENQCRAGDRRSPVLSAPSLSAIMSILHSTTCWHGGGRI